ncbi:hypothetical protein LXH09_36010 [Streptomyces sp. CS7]|uniref:hypothetical protein n=1 Tax=Streptomyces sp. CS-7 TaxID=2906769 RepID=UPI0021B2AE83|nr:hypothetical protein [Streptomyces sp. CS-7]MCT6782035.1 hypothetical protein [Streptomyces sp. CS-7]
MARNSGNGAPHRISDADDQGSAEQPHAEADCPNSLRRLRDNVWQMERDRAMRRRRVCTVGVALALASGAILTGLAWTVVTWGSASHFPQVDVICAVLTLISGVVAWVATPHRDQPSPAQMESMLATNREALRILSALIQPALKERHRL